MLAIKNAVIVMPDYYIPEGVILLENGKIKDFGREKEIAVPEGCEVIDADGMYAGPGLVDIHTHAGSRNWFYENPVAAAEAVLKHGVTDVLPTLYFDMSKAGYLEAIKLIKDSIASGKCPNISGLYMEGPYLNPKFGCDKDKNQWKGDIKREDYIDIIDAVKDLARVWSVAPEREGILDFVKDVKERIPSISFTVAHSEATPPQIEELIPYGMKIGTHHTNATGTLENYPECRGVCVDEMVNYNSSMYAEIISDSLGIHVDPYMQRLLLKIKGKERIILISDACIYDGPPIPGCEEAFDINFDFAGEIAGSKLTLDVACRNFMKHTGSSVCDIFRFASLNPARAVGLYDRGCIKKGNVANIVITDDWFNIKNIILKGEIVK